MKSNLTFSKPERSTVEYGYGEIHLMKSALSPGSYQVIARKLLDKLSAEYNPQGIEFLLTALIEEVESGYFGDKNGR